jgi:hypothetical protein
MWSDPVKAACHIPEVVAFVRLVWIFASMPIGFAVAGYCPLVYCLLWLSMGECRRRRVDPWGDGEEARERGTVAGIRGHLMCRTLLELRGACCPWTLNVEEPSSSRTTTITDPRIAPSLARHAPQHIPSRLSILRHSRSRVFLVPTNDLTYYYLIHSHHVVFEAEDNRKGGLDSARDSTHTPLPPPPVKERVDRSSSGPRLQVARDGSSPYHSCSRLGWSSGEP